MYKNFKKQDLAYSEIKTIQFYRENKKYDLLTFKTVSYKNTACNEARKHQFFEWTAEFGRFEMAQLLIQNSAKFNIDLNYNTGCRMTVFHVACQEDQIEIVELLIKNSIDYDIHLKPLKRRYLSVQVV